MVSSLLVEDAYGRRYGRVVGHSPKPRCRRDSPLDVALDTSIPACRSLIGINAVCAGKMEYGMRNQLLIA